MSQQAAGFLARPPFNHHWVLPDQDGKLHYLDRFEVLPMMAHLHCTLQKCMHCRHRGSCG